MKAQFSNGEIQKHVFKKQKNKTWVEIMEGDKK